MLLNNRRALANPNQLSTRRARAFGQLRQNAGKLTADVLEQFHPVSPLG